MNDLEQEHLIPPGCLEHPSGDYNMIPSNTIEQTLDEEYSMVPGVVANKKKPLPKADELKQLLQEMVTQFTSGKGATGQLLEVGSNELTYQYTAIGASSVPITYVVPWEWTGYGLNIIFGHQRMYDGFPFTPLGSETEPAQGGDEESSAYSKLREMQKYADRNNLLLPTWMNKNLDRKSDDDSDDTEKLLPIIITK